MTELADSQAAEEQKPKLEYTPAFVKAQLEDFYNEGMSDLERRKATYANAEKMYKQEYRNTDLPDDTIYFPTIKNEVMQIIRDIIQTYSNIEDIMAVNPETENALPVAALAAEMQEKILNGKINDKTWRNRNALIGKLALQAGVYGVGHAYVTWIRKEIEEPVYGPVLIQNEDGTKEWVQEKTGTRKVIVENYPDIEKIHQDHLIWDTNHADDWQKIDWTMRIEMKKTEREIREMIHTQGLKKAAVEKFLKTKPVESENNVAGEWTPKAEDNRPYRLREFYGWMRLKEDNKNMDFVRIIDSKDSEDLLLPPNNSKEHVHTWLDGRPMIPIVAGYLFPSLESIAGESLMMLGEAFQQEENSLRNAIRRSAESDVHSVWGLRKGSGLEHHNLISRQTDRIVWTNGNPREALAEFPHQDTTSSAHRYLELAAKDRQRTYGNTDYKIGMADPAITDTASGIHQMQTAANSVAMVFIKFFNETIIEPLFERILHMSVKYVTDKELESFGMTREQHNTYFKNMTCKTRLVVDAEQGATSVLAKRTMATQNYFISQEAVKYALGTGLVLPPKAMIAPFRFLKKLYETNGEKASGLYLPEPEEILRLSQEYQRTAGKEQADERAGQQQEVAAAEAQADERGYEAALAEQGTPRPQAQAPPLG